MKKYLFKTRYVDKDQDEHLRFTGRPKNHWDVRGQFVEYPTSSELHHFATTCGFDNYLEAVKCPITLHVDITDKIITNSMKVEIISLEV